MKNEMTSNIQLILEQKPFTLNIAIQYAKELSKKYKKIYCVVSPINESYINETTLEKLGDIISLNYYRERLDKFKLHYITKL